MVVRVLLHIRRESDGRAVVTPVEFPSLAKDGSSVEAARRRTVAALSQQAQSWAPQFRIRMKDLPPARLVELPVTRPESDDSEDIEVVVGLVILDRVSAGKPTYLAYAPNLAGVSVSANELANLLAIAVKKIGKALAKMSVHQAIAAGETGTVSLEGVDINVSEPEEEEADRSKQKTATPDDQIVRDAGVELTAGTVSRRVAGVEVREALVQRILAALATPERSCVVLVGRPDVGKTALIYEVADRISNGAVPPSLQGRPVWRVGANELISGAMFTGMWQARGHAVVRVAQKTRAIFAMGEPGAIIDAGRHYRSDNNLSRLFRPHMETGDLTLICECTEEGFAAARKQEPSFMDAFHRIDVPEPTPQETHLILNHAARSLKEAQQVEIDAGATEAALDLTRRFEPYRGLPGKCVRLLEETVRSAAASKVDRIGRAEVVQTFAQRSGMPLALLSDEVALRSNDVTEYLTARVLGQPEAVEAVVGVVMVVKAALQDSQKPLATLLFIGPTGVGKTELAKALAEYLFGSRDRVIRLDMGEYGTADAIQRLTGTTWTMDSDAELIRRIREQPFSVVLLDEIEKAHPSVYDALLAVTGEGRLTDARGQTADFRNAIVVMTSNLGATKATSGGLGFSAESGEGDDGNRVRGRYIDQVEKFFRPEFVNRIDRVVVFRSLDRETVLRIARRELGHLLLREGIVRRGILVEFGDDVVETLAGIGFHPRYGARPLQREIERAVIQPLARLLVEARPQSGDVVRVSADGDRIALQLQRVVEAAARAVTTRRPSTSAAPRSIEFEMQRAKEILERAERVISSEPGQYVLAERSRIVAETSDPEFWDQPPTARQSMSRLYLYQKLADDMDALRNRAEGLVELAQQIRRTKHRDRLGELRKALTEVEAALQRLTLEINAARVAGGADSATVQVTPIGAGTADWAEELMKMYSAWAERSGREVLREPEAGYSLIIKGPASAALLAGEAGLHRRIVGVDSEHLARVMVATVNGSSGATTRRHGGRRATVVRIYNLPKRLVRDPRTGVQVKDPAAVLREGKIDAFIVATLNSKS
jgi:ATP-dependent Clp protease ATP-binding subunit ClpA